MDRARSSEMEGSGRQSQAPGWGGILSLVGLLLSACTEAPPAPSAEKGSEERAVLAYEPDAPPDLCALRIQEIEENAADAPTPELDRHRAEILARARSVPLVFSSRPSASKAAPELVIELRRLLSEAEDPAQAILEVLRRTRGNYPLRREVFLSDQYLYAESPLLALRLSQVLRLDHLFSKAEDKLVIMRGTETLRVVRSEGRYFLPPIPDENPNKRHHLRVASLLLFDRVRTEGEEFGTPLHVDLRPLQRKLGFSFAKVRAMSADAMSVEFDTYGVKSRAAIDFSGIEARLECETPGETPLLALREARERYHLDQELIEPVMDAAHEMIFRQLPFDEPKTEEGQQDGLLRLHFKQAYRRYENTYEFNGDNYYVFDGYGRPRLPQVCIDFITDAYDWGTGGHWPKRGKRREYVRGALNFASMGMENARSVENLAEFATEHPDWFDVLWLPKEERVKFRHREEFFQQLAMHAPRYRRGDIVFIYGLRDDGKFHYHSFLIDEKDPVTGMPTVVVANAGPPQARSWEGEMQNAPQRSIVARVRVRREVLMRAHEQARRQPGVPLRFPEEEETVAEDTPDAALRVPAEGEQRAPVQKPPALVQPEPGPSVATSEPQPAGKAGHIAEPQDAPILEENSELRKGAPQATDGSP